MHCRISVILAFLLVASTTYAASAASGSEPNGPSKKWSVWLHETVFHAYDGVRVFDIPRGADGYKTSETVLSPNVGVGYALNQNWSVETFLQLGPKSTYVPTSAQSNTYPQVEFGSTFASLVAARGFSLGEKLRVVPKFGVARSSLSYKVDADAVNSESWKRTSIDPVVSVEVTRPINQSLSVSLDYTRYFTKEKEMNGAINMGIRFRF